VGDVGTTTPRDDNTLRKAIESDVAGTGIAPPPLKNTRNRFHAKMATPPGHLAAFSSLFTFHPGLIFHEKET